MGRIARTLSIACLLVGGCTTTRYVQRPRQVEEIRPLYTKARFHMTLLHARPAGATSVAPTSLVLVPGAPRPDPAAVPLVDLSNLRGYEIKRRGVGALEGLGIGIVAGFIAGAVIGASSGDSQCVPDTACVNITSSDLALFFGAIGAFAGSLIGPAAGALVGHTDRTVFTDGPAQR